MTNRLQAKSDLLLKLGRLFGPLEKLVESPNDFDEQERAEVLARYFSEYPELLGAFCEFSLSQPGHNYLLECSKFQRSLELIASRVKQGDDLKEIINESLKMARDAVQTVPTSQSSTILEAGTPFTAYCRLRALCEADARYSITWFDPYFDPSIFHRYLQFVEETVLVTLVAAEPSPSAGRKNRPLA